MFSIFWVLSFTDLLVWSVLGIQYVVHPKNNRNHMACAMTTTYLQAYLGQDNVQTYRFPIRDVTQLWIIECDESQAAQIRKDPDVLDVSENKMSTQNDAEPIDLDIQNSTSLYATKEEAIPTINQPDASPDLTMISWPQNKILLGKGPTGGYNYKPLAGLNTYVYVIDHGVNPQQPDFQDKIAYWNYSGPGVRPTETDDDPNGHGSCIASKAVGLVHGVSKSSKIVMIKASLTDLDTELAFATVYDDIVGKDRQYSSVVLYARSTMESYSFQTPLPPFWAKIREILVLLKTQRVKVVTSSGNDGLSNPSIDKLPALWSRDGLVYVVGAVASHAQIEYFLNGIAVYKLMYSFMNKYCLCVK